MYILAVETTGAFASVALMDGDRIIGHVQGNDRFSHLQNLMPQVDTVVKENKLSLDDIAAIAVSDGPGSFTGIRIGVSSARALSQILDIPCVPVSSLEALAMRAIEYKDLASSESEEGISEMDNLLICPILDARRGQIYGGGYLIKDGYPEEIIKGAPYMIEELLEKVEGFDRILLFGDGVDSYEERIMEIRPLGTQTAPESIRYQDAVSVAKLGAKIFNEKGGLHYLEVQPEYMRIAEAERKLKEKQAAEKAAAAQQRSRYI